jgi:ACR3 family arsenite transporter
MGLFERYLTLWVALGVGVGLGLAHVNLVVAVFIWVQINWSAVKDVGKKPLGLT